MWEATNQNCKHATMPRIDDATASAVVKSATAILLSVPALKAANGNLQTIATDLAAQLSAAQAQLGETDALKAALASANSTIAALDQADANLDNDISELKLAADALTEAVENPPVDTPPVDTPPTDVPPVEVPPTEVPPVETPPVEVPPTEVPAENP
jgi:septal ring factor EnvC (AmiA/AmiB activator)